MPTQYVRVLFSEDRGVEVDDAACGQTNQVLMLEEGTHRFTLEGEPDYAPAVAELVVTGTTPANPLQLLFILKAPSLETASASRTASGVATIAAGVAVAAAGVAVVAAGVAAVTAKTDEPADSTNDDSSETGTRPIQE